MQNSKYYYKLTQKLNMIKNQYGGVLGKLPDEIQGLIACQFTNYKDLIKFAELSKKTMNAIKNNMYNIILYFKALDPDNILVWNEYVHDPNSDDNNYASFIKICKRLELVRLGLNIATINRDVELTNEKLRILKELHSLGLHQLALEYIINNFTEDQFKRLLYLRKEYNNYNEQNNLILIAQSNIAFDFFNTAISQFNINLSFAVEFVRNLSDICLQLSILLLSDGINARVVYDILIQEGGQNNEEQMELKRPFLMKIREYKSQGIKDAYLYQLAQILDTPEKEAKFFRLLNKVLDGDKRISQRVALMILLNDTSDQLIFKIEKLIESGIEQEYVVDIAFILSHPQLKTFFILKNKYSFDDKYALLIARLFERDRIDNIFRYITMGFTIPQAFTIERHFNQERKDLIRQLLKQQYPANIIYTILTGAANNVDNEDVPIEIANNMIANINIYRGQGFTFEQAYKLLDYPRENILLLRQRYNTEIAFDAKAFNLDKIHRMISLTSAEGFTDDAAFRAAESLTSEQIDTMINLINEHGASEYYAHEIAANFNLEQIEIFIEFKRLKLDNEQSYNLANHDNIDRSHISKFIAIAKRSGNEEAYRYVMNLLNN